MLSLLLVCISLVPSNLHIGTDFSYGIGRFSDAGGTNPRWFEYQGSFEGKQTKIDFKISVGKAIRFGAGVRLEYDKTEKFPNKYYNWIFDGSVLGMQTIQDARHQYTYGGRLFLEYHYIVSPYISYGFKNVATYRTYIYRTNWYSGNHTDITQTAFTIWPAYDGHIGLIFFIPKTPISIFTEKSLTDQIWDTSRDSYTIGFGLHFEH